MKSHWLHGCFGNLSWYYLSLNNPYKNQSKAINQVYEASKIAPKSGQTNCVISFWGTWDEEKTLISVYLLSLSLSRSKYITCLANQLFNFLSSKNTLSLYLEMVPDRVGKEAIRGVVFTVMGYISRVVVTLYYNIPIESCGQSYKASTSVNERLYNSKCKQFTTLDS